MGVFRGRHIEADDFGRLADEIGIGAFAPRFASRKVDFVGPQEPPDILLVHVAKRPGEQPPSSWPSPAAAWRQAAPEYGGPSRVRTSAQGHAGLSH